MEIKVYGGKEKSGAKIGVWDENPRPIEPRPVGQIAKKSVVEPTKNNEM